MPNLLGLIIGSKLRVHALICFSFFLFFASICPVTGSERSQLWD